MHRTANSIYNPMTNMPLNDQIVASDLLNSVKSGIKDTAAALTETASPEVHRILEQQLQQGLRFHEQLTQFMINKGWYKPYDVRQMIQADLQQTQQINQQLGQYQSYQQPGGQQQYQQQGSYQQYQPR
ncbi:MAG: spore coat protein [Bacillota bacterium]|jgi:similar to spore coat protein